MTEKINSYFAVLLITIAGACASLLIIRISNSSTLATTFNGSEAHYSSLQQSILK